MPTKKATVTAPTAKAQTPETEHVVDLGLTYGQACKLISRILVGSPSSDPVVEAIRDLIDGAGLPSAFVETSSDSDEE
jgi:hypothetical protein